MNTVLSSYNGLTLLALALVVTALVLYSVNGYSVRRRHIVKRGTGTGTTAHIVSRHYSLDKARQALHNYAEHNSEPGVFTLSSTY